MEEGTKSDVVILIPAYNPDEKLVALVGRLREKFSRIVIVNDGSETGVEIFDKVSPLVETVLVHSVNRGKGAALKKGFAYLKNVDVITADADGQHTPEDIARVAEALKTHKNGLVLGVRAFAGKVPFRSRFGNFWTRWFFFLMTGLMIRDTQTGLRGIPSQLLDRVSRIPGGRYEYEMAMLADAKNHDQKPLQIPIETVYIENNATSHFKPIADTVRIYRSLFQYCLSSVLSFVLDVGIFSAITYALTSNDFNRQRQIVIATVTARFVSSNFNYLYNRFVVFYRQRRHKKTHNSYYSYMGLVIVIAAFSYAFTGLLSSVMDVNGLAITLVKVFVDAVLFITSYWIQKKIVFRSRK